ncbi:hypothetical protein E2C01_004668 [Portunus trituberculatus]|uniref:Uncharacterized protein n=1 Tax=Portunus trituberculatus TaxID=210409 RepID=A0A5B7CSX7_PORTR|nr:hypothetical protein [Portunus trituberculatus]
MWTCWGHCSGARQQIMDNNKSGSSVILRPIPVVSNYIYSSTRPQVEGSKPQFPKVSVYSSLLALITRPHSSPLPQITHTSLEGLVALRGFRVKKSNLDFP